MITVYRPNSVGSARALPHSSGDASRFGFRFGLCAESLLRKHGWISVHSASAIGATAALVVVPRVDESDAANGPDYERAGVREGPLTAPAAAALGVHVTNRSARGLEVFDEARRHLGTICWPSLDVRVIPAARGIRSDPYPFAAADERWNRTTIDYQTIQPTGGWRPVLWAREVGGDAEVLPIAVNDGERLVLGVSLLEIAIGAAAFPPLDVGYWAHRDCPSVFGLEVWLAEQIGELLTAARLPGVRVRRWPDERAAALTVRHDYDRLVADDVLDRLLASYAALGVRSSWGFLVDKAPRSHADRIEAAGHEVMLHSIAGSEAALRAEIRSLIDATGCRPRGSTAHGGVGAPGYLGEHHFRWANEVGFDYAELLGRSIGLPAQAVITSQGYASPSPVLLPNQHLSLDRTTKPEGHALSALRAIVPTALVRGEHIVIMNHPDIHRDELLSLLGDIDQSRVWSVTFRDLVAWSNATKFNALIDFPLGRIEFGAPLSAPATIDVFGGGSRWTVEAGIGDTRASILRTHSGESRGTIAGDIVEKAP
jgi:hypothetical protein